MASEIRVNRLTNRVGLNTITFANGGVQFSGITTFANGEFYVGTGATILNTAGNTLDLHTNGTSGLKVQQSGSVIAGVTTLSTAKVTGDLTVSGNAFVSGTLTYEDLKNVDSVGVITARTDIHVGAGVSAAGIITATSYRGDGSQLTGITGTTINNNADNRVITGSGTANTLNGESALTFDGTTLTTTQFNVLTGANAFQTSANVFKGASGQKGVYLRSALSSATTPSYSSVDDTNTGIFLPGSDVFAVTTGGTERLRITSGGQVRIANTDLTTSSKADDLIVGTTSGHTGITIFSGTGETGNIYFGDTDTAGVGNRMGTITYDHSGNYMRFSTSGNQERFRILSGGDVQVKTNGGKLYGSGTFTVFSGSTAGRLDLYGGSTNHGGEIQLYGGSNNDGIIMFRTGAGSGQQSEKLRITSAGDVHQAWRDGAFIGQKYDNDYYMGLTFGVSSRTLFIDNRSNDTRADIVFRTVEAQTAPVERLRISSAGRVLIATTTEGHGNADDLTVATAGGSLGNTGITIRSSTTGDGNIFFSDATSGDGETKGVIKYAHNGDSLRFNTAGSERLRITSDGHVLFSGVTTNNDTRNPNGITVKSSSGISFLNYGSNGSRNWRIRPDDLSAWGSLEFSVSPTDNSSTDWPDASTDVVLELKKNKDVKIHDGNLIIGTAGHGIDFSNQTASSATGASTSSELLDHYEEGTWTPVFESTSTDPTYSNWHTTGTYIRIGGMCYVWFDPHQITFSGTDAAGYGYISGFPFASTDNGSLACGKCDDVLKWAGVGNRGDRGFSIAAAAATGEFHTDAPSRGFTWDNGDGNSKGYFDIGGAYKCV